ncbi:MAG: limonene-1,2-epoxide hydrolase family protein [Caulobacteraceae bacterium]|nr:limonene-1,2-epoxide hydrolase family protein [Caulobacteraceae bacterium]
MSHLELVRAFIGAWEARDLEGILARLTPNAFYHNVGTAPAIGAQAIRGLIEGFLGGAEKVEWTVHHIAETPSGAVLTERTDVFVMGGKPLTIPVMGVFEFEGDLISSWRDYFDLPGFQAQMAG